MSSAELRALAHPLRLRLLEVLRADGPATASQLGRRLGVSSGATSYHLRALHRAGMVTEAEQLNGRERWWQRAAEMALIPNAVPPEASEGERAELQAAHAQIESFFVAGDERALSRWTEIRYDLPLEWQDAQWIGNLTMWATAAEVQKFVELVIELVQPYRDAPAADSGSERVEVHFTFRVLPQEPAP
jgi:DNA-binding transcriptional ArsR family regulator